MGQNHAAKTLRRESEPMYQAFANTDQVTFSLDPFLSKAADSAADIPFGILENRCSSLMRIDGKDSSLRSGDIALISTTSPITLTALTSGASLDARLFLLPIAINSSVGPNPMIDSLMRNEENAHIVFRRIQHNLTRGYCDQLARLAQVRPQDKLLEYQQSAVAGLLLTELSRSDLNAMMIIESDFPETSLHHTPSARQEALILNYIMDNIGSVTLRSAAHHFDYDTNYFSRLSRRLFGKTFSEEVRFIRMNQAKKLLELSPKPVFEIATSLGYKNLATFDHNFKAHTGMTPSEFRSAAQTGSLSPAELSSPASGNS
jgi:AraC-like DNA-binding protein